MQISSDRDILDALMQCAKNGVAIDSYPENNARILFTKLITLHSCEEIPCSDTELIGLP